MVDAHHHLWDPAAAEYPWMTDDIAAIRRRFAPEDLKPLLEACGIDNTVVVQARQDSDETRELLALTQAHDFIAGVVGWADLQSSRLAEAVADLRAGPGGARLVGLRHLVQDEPDPNWLRRDKVLLGLQTLQQLDLAYDILVTPTQLVAAVETAKSLPGMRLVLDHLGKPPIASRQLAPWASLVEPFAELPNVFCKFSGMVTEADLKHWEPAHFVPYVTKAWEWFGEDRVMFGSDWPVCLLAGTYGQVVGALETALVEVIDLERVHAKVFGANAMRFYRLNGWDA